MKSLKASPEVAAASVVASFDCKHNMRKQLLSLPFFFLNFCEAPFFFCYPDFLDVLSAATVRRRTLFVSLCKTGRRKNK